MSDRDELAQHFRGVYGRMCVLTARAITQGHPRVKVMQASRGEGDAAALVYIQLREQRGRMDRSLDRCWDAGVPVAQVVQAGREVRDAVQQEFMVTIPVAARNG